MKPEEANRETVRRIQDYRANKRAAVVTNGDKIAAHPCTNLPKAKEQKSKKPNKSAV